jgi:riboflavin synthase
MFTGIVTDIGEVLGVKARADNLHRLKIACSYPRLGIADGASIACSGVCLTVVGAGEEDGRTWFAADAAAETLRLTTAGTWRHGSRLNLERALKIGDELGGHLVLGHVDGVAEVVTRDELPEMARLAFRAPAALSRLGRARRGVAHGQRGRGRHVRGAGDPAHAAGDDVRRAARRRQGQSRGRSVGALRGAADGRALTMQGTLVGWASRRTAIAVWRGACGAMPTLSLPAWAKSPTSFARRGDVGAAILPTLRRMGAG